MDRKVTWVQIPPYPPISARLINTNMPEIKINLTKWYHFLIATVPVVAMVATGLMWIDTRYMHREISDTRFIELQIRIVEGHIRDYTRIVDAGGTIPAQDTVKYQIDLHQLNNLMNERNKILGIGGLPQ